MKKIYYVEESEDLKLARQKDAADYKEFLNECAREELRWGYSVDVFNHLYDAE